MAFQTKTDYAGLATTFSSALETRDDTNNATNETYYPQGQDGSFCAIEVYGEDAAPTNNYAVKANLTASADALVLGNVSSVSSKKYMLESVTITTGAGAVPTISATSQLVESAATTQSQYKIPAFSVTTRQVAQVLFGAFTPPASGATLTACSATISCAVGKDKLAGVIIASDVGSGYIEVTGTLLQTGATAPTITVNTADNWVLTAPLTCTNPETAYPTYTFTVRKNLAKTTASQQQVG